MKCTKISSDQILEIQNISCVLETLVKEVSQQKIPPGLESASVFDQVSPTIMSAEQQKDPVLGLVHQYPTAGNELKPSEFAKLWSKVECNSYKLIKSHLKGGNFIED